MDDRDPSSVPKSVPLSLRTLLAAAAVALPIASGVPAPVAAAPLAAATASGAPAWWSYDRPATTSTVHTQLRVPMRDGVRLGCDLHRPARSGKAIPGKYPSIVYEVTPYAAATPIYLEQGEWLAARGYAAITCTVRGSGRSGGTFPQPNQPAEQTDAYDLVEWVAAQPWSTGRVGQTGESYGGMMTYRAAASGAPHLVAAVPQQAPNDLYLDDVYPGGVPAAQLTHQWWPVIASVASLGRIDPTRLFAVQRRHPTRDAFWQQIAIDSVLDRVDVPILALAGWNDPLFRDGATRNFERLVARRGTDDTYLISGPWTHGGVFAWPSCRVIGAACGGGDLVPRGALLAWFDHWVAQRPGAPLPTATVTSYQGPKGIGAGWRERSTVFPPAETQTFAFAQDGSLRAEVPAGTSAPGGGAVADGVGPAGERSWTADPSDGIVRAAPTVTFTTPPLPVTDLAGRPKLTVQLRSSRPDAYLLAELRWIRPDGTAKRISEAWLRASHGDSHETPTPLVAGQRTPLELELEPLDLRLPAGSRLELRIGSGSALLVKALSRRTVSIATGDGGSTLELPIAR